MRRWDLPTPKVHSTAGRIIPKANIPINTSRLLSVAMPCKLSRGDIEIITTRRPIGLRHNSDRVEWSGGLPAN